MASSRSPPPPHADPPPDPAAYELAACAPPSGDNGGRPLHRRLARRALFACRDWRDPPVIDASRVRRANGRDTRLVGFVKFHNEGGRSGNLERCLRHMGRFCDDIAVCNSGSTDDSLQIAQKFTDHVITVPDDFRRELYDKQALLEYTLKLSPDWIVWLDPDEVFDRAGELGGIRALCGHGDRKKIDAFSFLYHNLWKSPCLYRTDELWLQNWQTKLWKNTGRLRFDTREGLHHDQSPESLSRIKRATVKVIHYGFSTERFVSQKYDVYKRHGQSGRLLERIRDESTLRLVRFSPDWYPPSALKVSVVCLIYKSPGYAKFVHESFNRHTGGGRRPMYGNVEFTFVANDPTDRLVEFLRSAGMNHTVFRNPDPAEHYMNRVYRAWNHGGMAAAETKSDVVVFVNSDMAFTTGWLDGLLRRLDEKTVVTSRLVESGKLRSGMHGIEKNFGTTHSEFDDAAFQKFAKKISRDKARPGGLFMPCALYADTFRRSGGYPVGNRTEPDGTVTSGDAIFFNETLKAMGVSHVTAFDSIVYHVQEGEKDE